MEDFKKELKELMLKHKVTIAVRQEENDSFLYLNIENQSTYKIIDSGYRDLEITPNNLN